MLLRVHAICGSASAPIAEHQRRAPRTAGDREVKQNRQIIGALVERFRHFSDLPLHLVALHGRKISLKPRPCHCPRDWSIGPAHELRQLGAGVDAQLGERIVDVVFHRMERKVQPLCH
jgi:hypothetical protein